jgi:hypothetical protein
MFFPQDTGVVWSGGVFAFRLFYIAQSSEMLTKHEINIEGKCGKKLVMLIFNLV